MQWLSSYYAIYINFDALVNFSLCYLYQFDINSIKTIYLTNHISYDKMKAME